MSYDRWLRDLEAEAFRTDCTLAGHSEQLTARSEKQRTAFGNVGSVGNVIGAAPRGCTIAFISAVRSFSVFSQPTGWIPSRTGPSGVPRRRRRSSRAALASPRTLVNSATNASATLFFARALMRCTVEFSSYRPVQPEGTVLGPREAGGDLGDGVLVGLVQHGADDRVHRESRSAAR